MPHISRPCITTDLCQLNIKDVEYFNKSFDRLCKRWWDKASPRSNTSAGMLVTSKLSSHINEPLILSIIADDLECFKKYYDKGKDIFCLEFSCLCGSEKIIKQFYLQDQNKACLRQSKNAIAYALSSGKKELALLLAKTSIELKKQDPGPVLLYSFGDYSSAKTIKQMFVETESSVKEQVICIANEVPNAKKARLE